MSESLKITIIGNQIQYDGVPVATLLSNVTPNLLQDFIDMIHHDKDYDKSYNEGYDIGYDEGYNKGYNEGYDEGQAGL